MAVSTSQISPLEHLDKSESVLLGMLAMLESSKEICAATMVNLTYLLDEFSYQHDGVTLTGFDYVSEDEGPNAANNEVEKGLGALVNMGLVHYSGTSDSSGHPPQGYRRQGYRIDRQVKLADIPLSVDDWALIHSVIREYGDMNHADTVEASRRTLPMKNGVRYGRLQFQPNPEIEAFKQLVRDDDDFMEKCMAALADGSEGVDVEELRGALVAEQIDS